MQYLSNKLKRFEIQKLNQYDLLVAITDRDLEMFRAMGYKNGCISSPVGYKVGYYEIDTNSFAKPLKLSFIGSLDWLPNLQGLEWFCQKSGQRFLKDFQKLNSILLGEMLQNHWLERHIPMFLPW